MKGIPGLVVAIVFGVLGAVVNMVYLWKGRDIETVSFVGIKEETEVESGKIIRADHLAPVRIPRESVGNLVDYAYLYSDAGTVVGQKSSRSFEGGELVLRDDLRTPPAHLNLKANEAVVWVIVNSSTVVASQIIPEVTPVSFFLPQSRGATATEFSQATIAGWELVGPFEVLAVGNRLGSTDVMEASRIPPQDRNKLALRVTFDENGQMTSKMQDLVRYVQQSNFAPLNLMLHPAASKKR